MEIISRYYYQKGKVESALKHDPDVALAVSTLKDPEKYNAILSGKFTPPATEKDGAEEDGTDMIVE
jgi:hypothetical protein